VGGWGGGRGEKLQTDNTIMSFLFSHENIGKKERGLEKAK